MKRMYLTLLNTFKTLYIPVQENYKSNAFFICFFSLLLLLISKGMMHSKPNVSIYFKSIIIKLPTISNGNCFIFRSIFSQLEFTYNTNNKIEESLNSCYFTNFFFFKKPFCFCLIEIWILFWAIWDVCYKCLGLKGVKCFHSLIFVFCLK